MNASRAAQHGPPVGFEGELSRLVHGVLADGMAYLQIPVLLRARRQPASDEAPHDRADAAGPARAATAVRGPAGSRRHAAEMKATRIGTWRGLHRDRGCYSSRRAGSAHDDNPMNIPLRAVLLAVALACAGAWSPARADGQASRPIDLDQALDMSREAAGSVRGARLDRQAKVLQAESLANLGGPALSLSGFAGRVSTSFNLDIARLANAANPVIGGVDAALPGIGLAPLPQTLSTQRIFDLGTVGLTADWPIYTAGRLGALRGLAEGRGSEAQADVQEAEDRTATLTAQRYFAVQLARRALQVRRDVESGIADHQRMAARMEAGGLIATAERLKADVALDGARRDLAKSRSDLEIAQLALERHLGADTPVAPTSPLFVHTQGVGSLRSFVDAGLAHHPAWVRIAAKRQQAEQSVHLRDVEHLPTVLGVANYNANRSSDQLVQPNWFVGVLVSVPLVSHVDHGKALEAARLERQRVEESAAQAGRDVPTLIESQWRTMENARAQFLSMESGVRLARESLRLQTIAFQQSQSTTLDVTDARLALAKVETERVQAAYDYVIALARLLEACGQPQRLAELARSADIQLPIE
jgi:outer membrane protein TolC